MESFILGYVYGQNQRCSGIDLGHETSLKAAQASCDTNEKCTCIYDEWCDGKNWWLSDAQFAIYDPLDCAWTKQGSLIWKFEQQSLREMYVVSFIEMYTFN